MRRVHEWLDAKRHQILALAREPSEEEVIVTDLTGFRCMGFDLIEEATQISALTNCRGFEGAFLPTDLSSCGLVPTAPRAYPPRTQLAPLPQL